MGLGDFMWDLGKLSGTWGLYVGLGDFCGTWDSRWDLVVLVDFCGTWVT